MSLKPVQDYFSFTKKELNGLLVLLLLLLLLIVFPIIYQPDFIAPKVAIEQFKKEAEAFERSGRLERAYSYRDVHTASEKHKISYFNFDPNGLPPSDWQRLGLTDKQIGVIKYYEAKGGRFYSKADVAKMYVISPELYARLEPYIQIDGAKLKPLKTGLAIVSNPIPLIDVNTADSATLQKVRGIGPAFASRIVRYRDRLGGFYSVEQLKEVYGVDSVKFVQWLPQLRLNATVLRKININEVDFEVLKKHPYLSYKQVNAILQYRKQHGPYAGLDDLRKVTILNDEILRKIAPYLNFQ